MKLKMITGIMLTIFVIASCQSDAQQEFNRYYNGGKIIYEQKCQNCHGAKGEGLLQLIPPLTDSAYLKANKATLSCMIKYGIQETIITIKGKSYVGAMPANDLAPVEVAKVLTFITNSFGNKMGVITVETVDNDLKSCK